MYDMKALYEASSVADAVALRLAHPEAQIIAGGSDVLVQMREGKRAGKELISIYGIDALRGVSMDEEENLRIGSLTSFSHITRDPLIQKYINVLGEAVDQVGGPQIRNIGTIGGNTCNGVTSADSASTLHAWEAVIELTGPDGVRRENIHDFYIKAGQVDIRPGEIQTAILIPKASYENTFGHYIKYAMRNAMGHCHPGDVRECAALRGQKDGGALPHRLRRRRPRSHAGRSTPRQRPTGSRFSVELAEKVRPCGAGGHQSPRQLARLQGVPSADRSGERQARI
jgi:CO/xanthine dehydrogenase FAD-binding subunit